MADGSSYGIWADCDDKSLDHRVAIKGNAVNIAQRIVNEMKLKLQSSIDNAKASSINISENLEELQEIIASEETIRQEYRQHQILVGVAGASGAGKTSAINAWLNVADLLPSSFEQAATAVVCLVSWNYDERPGYQFRAEIDFHSTEVIRQEVDEFFEVSQERRETGNPDDESDVLAAESKRELDAHFKSMLLKIKAVWGREEDELERMNAESLWNSRPQVLALLGTTKDFHSSESKILSKNVSPFLDSKKGKHGAGEAFAAWPLVKCVRIFLHSDVLKYGLTLVDLPGLGDANSARAQIARDFFPKLATTVIVSPIDRAADEKTAHDLLDEHHEIRLQLDGKYNAQGFGFVLSKSDNMEPLSFLKHATDRPNLRPARNQHAVYQQISDELVAAGIDLKMKRKTLRPTKAKDKKLGSRIKKARSRLLKAVNISTEEKETIEQEIEDLEAQRRGSDGRLKVQEKAVKKAEKHQEEVLELRSEAYDELKHLCVQARNDFVVERIQEDIGQRLSHNQSMAEPSGQAQNQRENQVRVIPISSTAYWLLSEGLDSRGFSDKQMTGIPQVRQWLSSSAKVEWEKSVDMTLHQYSCLLRRLHECSAEYTDDGRQARYTTEEVDKVLKEVQEEFTQALALHLNEWTAEIDAINPLSGRNGVISKNLKKFPQLISSWSLRYPDDETSSTRMLWGTYGANLRRHGVEHKSLNGTTYRWLDKLVRPFLKELVQDWNTEIHQKVPELQKRISDSFATHWGSYMISIRYRLAERCPELAVKLENQGGTLTEIRNTILDHIAQALNIIKTDAALAHPKLRDSLQKSFMPIFGEALSIRGQGSYQRRREIVYQKGVAGGKSMLDDAFKEVQEQLNSNKTKAQKQLDRIAELTIAKVQIPLSRMTPNSQDQRNTNPDLQRHLSACLADIQHLSTEWQTEWSKPLPDPSCSKDASVPIKTEEDAEMQDATDESGSEFEMDSDDDMSTDDDMERPKKRQRREFDTKLEEY